MSHDSQNILVSTAWVADRLAEPTLCVLDASWYLPAQARNPKAEYEASPRSRGPLFRYRHDLLIPRATFPTCYRAPRPSLPRRDISALATTIMIVVYDGSGLMSAARVWWMFRAFGHRAVAVMDGGFPQVAR